MKSWAQGNVLCEVRGARKRYIYTAWCSQRSKIWDHRACRTTGFPPRRFCCNLCVVSKVVITCVLGQTDWWICHPRFWNWAVFCRFYCTTLERLRRWRTLPMLCLQGVTPFSHPDTPRYMHLSSTPNGLRAQKKVFIVFIWQQNRTKTESS